MIRPEDFDEMLGILEETLRAFNLAEAERDAFLSDLRRRRGYIVGTKEQR